MSVVLWLPTIWMLSIASKPLGVWFGGGAVDMESGSPLDRVFHIVLLCLGLFILSWKRFDWSRTIKKNTWLILLIGYMLISTLWSDIPLISFKRCIRQLEAVIMAVVVSIELSPRQAMESLFRRTAYILTPFSMLLIKYYRDIYGVQYDRWTGEAMWIGVTLQKNSLGRLCLISGFFLIWTLIRRWQGRDNAVGKYRAHADLFILILTLWLLKGPPGKYPATAVVTLVVGLVVFISLLWMKKYHINLRFKTLAAIMIFVIGMGIVAPLGGGSNLSGLTSSLGRDDTLTGRTEIWRRLLPIAMSKPIFGHGFGGFWTSKTVETHGDSEAHSGYLDVILGFGIVGIVLLVMFLLSCAWNAQQELPHDFDWASLWICYLIMAVLHNITESSIHGFATHLTAVLIFLAVSSTAADSY